MVLARVSLCLWLISSLLFSPITILKSVAAEEPAPKKKARVAKSKMPPGIPLKFNSAALPLKPILKIEVKSKNSALLGNRIFSTNRMKILWTKSNKNQRLRGSGEEAQEKLKYTVSFSWPLEFLGQEGRLELRSMLGKPYWQKDVSKAELLQWRNTLLEPSGLEEIPLEEPINETVGRTLRPLWRGHEKSHFGLIGVDLEALNLDPDEAFRFCMLRGGEEGFRLAVCSKPYRFDQSKDGSLKLVALRRELVPKITIGNQVFSDSAEADFDPQAPPEFQVIFGDGSSLKGVSGLQKIPIEDFHILSNGDLLITGQGPPALEGAKVYQRAAEGWFSPTIGAPSESWKVVLKKDQWEFWGSGEMGINFLCKIDAEKIPDEKYRLVLDQRTPQSTYLERITLKGYKNPAATVSAKESTVRTIDKNTFEWEFLAPEKSALNTQSLEVSGANKAELTYSLYRGYPFETSLRLTGGYSGGAIAYFGEFYLSSWFETLFGWENYYFGRQRWGVSSRFFNSLSPFKVGGGEIALGHFNFDLKYRLSPGIWGYDESWGLILGYQSMTYQSQSSEIASLAEATSQLGVGFFWARSMPRIFDSLFNIIPFFRYPKWVDLDLIYYLSSFNPHQELRSNFMLNFHGKIYWSKMIYGEAGLAFKKIGINQLAPTSVEANSLIVLGTVGLGINF